MRVNYEVRFAVNIIEVSFPDLLFMITMSKRLFVGKIVSSFINHYSVLARMSEV